MANNWRRRLARARFIVGAAIGAACLIGLILFAIYDSVSSAQTSEQQFRESTLSAELSNFLLAIREPDGSSLLENPKDFSLAERSLGFVSLRRSFYSYLLNRANARLLTVDKVVWDTPRPCIVEFSAKSPPVTVNAPFAVQACFAVVPSEAEGRYAYFTLRYPTPTIVRHKPGARLGNADRVVLSFGAERPLVVTLVYEPPILAASRYPSQMERFSGIHEVSAFLASSPDRALRQVNAQAFERVGEGDDRRNFVTIVGRIDAGLLDGQSIASAQWPSATIESMKIGLEIFTHTDETGTEQAIQISPNVVGETLASLQKAYLSNVTTGSRLQITRPVEGRPQRVWSSSDLNLPSTPRRAGWTQALSDWWAPKLMRLFSQKPEPASVAREHRIAGPGGDFSASLTAAPALLPVVATRAFGWLTAALILVLVLAGLGGVAVFRLAHLTQSAWSMALTTNYAVDKQRYGRKRDEISTLGRVLNLLFSRNRSRNTHLVQRIRRESTAKATDLRLMQAQLDLRQDRLDAIGHEIRSPLQTMLNRTVDDESLQVPLKRMRNAVETIFEAASVEDGINGLEVICTRTDVASFLSSLVANKSEVVESLRYEGPTQDVWSSIDDIQFETVMDHLIDNAQRYKSGNSSVIVRLEVREQGLVVEVFNQGRSISEENLKSLFKYRNSDRSTSRNRGIGLYASRAYLLRMKATISAENRMDGVAMVIKLPAA